MDFDLKHSFDDLPLSSQTKEILHRIGYVHPSPIQFAAIPRILAGVDIIGQARTGTGKTAAFMLPMMEKLVDQDPPQGLVLVPTRELAVQVVEEGRKLAGDRKVNVVAIYGGSAMRQQIKALEAGAHIVVGTPGRIIDLMDRGILRLGAIRTITLDEADRMLDIGFRKDIERILRRTPEQRQTLLFSATMPEPVLRLTTRYMKEPEQINLSQDDMSVGAIDQRYISVADDKKLLLLLHLLVRERPRQCLIFCQMKTSVHELAEQLKRRVDGVKEMSGDLRQEVRDRVMRDFRSGKLRIVVATDVVGRGIDVEGVSHVINYDIPEDPEAYVHRIGRTGRMGKDGTAFTFVTPEQGRLLTMVEIFIGKQIAADRVESFEPYDVRPAALSDAQREKARRPVTRRGGPPGGRGKPSGRGRVGRTGRR